MKIPSSATSCPNSALNTFSLSVWGGSLPGHKFGTKTSKSVMKISSKSQLILCIGAIYIFNFSEKNLKKKQRMKTPNLSKTFFHPGETLKAKKNIHQMVKFSTPMGKCGVLMASLSNMCTCTVLYQCT